MWATVLLAVVLLVTSPTTLTGPPTVEPSPTSTPLVGPDEVLLPASPRPEPEPAPAPVREPVPTLPGAWTPWPDCRCTDTLTGLLVAGA